MLKNGLAKMTGAIKKAVGMGIYHSPPTVIALTYLAASLIGGILLALPAAAESGKPTPFLDSFFTAVSATCITGFVLYDTAPYWSTFGEIVILILMQLGGLGFITFATFFLSLAGRKAGLKNMKLAQESLNSLSIHDIIPLVRQILVMIFIVELAGAFLLSIAFVPRFGLAGLYYGIFHSVSAFCNAGFDLMGNNFASMADFSGNPLVLYTISVLVIIGGFGFMVWRDFMDFRKEKKLTAHTRMVLILSAILLLVAALFIFLSEENGVLAGMTLGEKINASIFLSVNARSAGFSTIDTGSLNDLSKAFIALMMFIGGASGSAAGGVKVNTLGIMLAAIICVIRGKDETILFKRRIPNRTVLKAFSIAFLALILVFVVTLVFHVLKPDATVIDAFFDSVSAFGTVGLTTGVASNLTGIGKILVILCMFTGRIGPISFALALTPGVKHSDHTVYPEGKFIVG